MSQACPNQDTIPASAKYTDTGNERTPPPDATIRGTLATPLLPGTRSVNDEYSPVTNGSNEPDPSLGQTSLANSSAQSRPLHGKIACQACQRRKAKCSGQAEVQPIQFSLRCDFCTRSGVQCVWRPPKRNVPSTNTRRRPNTATRTGSSQDGGEDSSLTPQIKSACAECRRRKQRCTGDRPSCQFCGEKGMECSYEVADGMTRSEDLKSKVREATERGDRLDQLVDAMRQGTDQQSSQLLARLRIGATLDDLLDPETRLNYFPEYRRNGEVDRSAWLASSGGGACLNSRAVDEVRVDKTPDTQATTAEGSRGAVSTPTTTPSFAFDFSTPRLQLSPEDIDMANDPFNRHLPPS